MCKLAWTPGVYSVSTYNMNYWVVKLFFVTSLFLIFLFLFGKPSLEKYLKKDTIFVESKVKFDYRNPPAVTLLSTKTHLFLALKDCQAKQSYDSVTECYNQHFSNKTQVLQPSSMSSNFSWANDIPFGEEWGVTIWYIKCHIVDHWIPMRTFPPADTMFTVSNYTIDNKNFSVISLGKGSQYF